jgi:hypothetical protein
MAAQALASTSNFELLVAQLLSADNDARKNAEALYEQVKGFPDQCVAMLVHVMKASPSVEHRAFCAVMLRKVRRRALGGPAAARPMREPLYR